MIPSLQRIEFISKSGKVTTLLDFGDDLAEPIPLPTEQQSSNYAPIGAKWGHATGNGAARGDIAFSRFQQHASHAEVINYCALVGVLMPYGQTGVIRMHIREPDVLDDEDDIIWEFSKAVIHACVPQPFVGEGFPTITSYRASAGARRPIKGNFGNCYPFNWWTIPMNQNLVPMNQMSCAVDPSPPVTTPGNPGALVVAGTGSTPLAPGEMVVPDSGATPLAPGELVVPGTGAVPGEPGSLVDDQTGPPMAYDVGGILTPAIADHLIFAGDHFGRHSWTSDGERVDMDRPEGTATLLYSAEGIWILLSLSFDDDGGFLGEWRSAIDTIFPDSRTAHWQPHLGTGVPIFTRTA